MPGSKVFGKRSRRERERARERRLERRKARAERYGRIARGALIAAVLLLSFLPMPFVASPVSYVPFMTVVLVLVVDRAYLAAAGRALSYDEEAMAPTCERGQRVDFSVAFANRSFLPCPRVEVVFYISDLFGDYSSERRVTCALLPKERCDFHFDARFAHLGTYAAGVDRVTVHDLLGLWSTTSPNTRRNEVRVLPQLFDPGRVELSSVSLKESHRVFRPIVTDDIDYAGVREYRNGDPMKSVHWKLTSRSADGEMFTRLYEVLGNPGVETVVDPFAPDYDSEDLMHVFDGLVEGALSINDYARRVGMDARVSFVDSAGEPASMQVLGASDADALMGRVHVVQRASEDASAAASAAALLRRQGRSVHGMGNVAYCTSRLEEGALSALVEMRMRRRNPLLLLVVPRSVEGRERDEFLAPLRRLDAAGVGYYIVESTEERTEVVGA